MSLDPSWLVPLSATQRLEVLFAHWNEFGPHNGFGDLLSFYERLPLPMPPVPIRQVIDDRAPTAPLPPPKELK